MGSSLCYDQITDYRLRGTAPLGVVEVPSANCEGFGERGRLPRSSFPSKMPMPAAGDTRLARFAVCQRPGDRPRAVQRQCTTVSAPASAEIEVIGICFLRARMHSALRC